MAGFRVCVREPLPRAFLDHADADPTSGSSWRIRGFDEIIQYSEVVIKPEDASLTRLAELGLDPRYSLVDRNEDWRLAPREPQGERRLPPSDHDTRLCLHRSPMVTTSLGRSSEKRTCAPRACNRSPLMEPPSLIGATLPVLLNQRQVCSPRESRGAAHSWRLALRARPRLRTVLLAVQVSSMIRAARVPDQTGVTRPAWAQNVRTVLLDRARSSFAGATRPSKDH